MYTLLILVHIAAAIVWIGGGLYGQILSQRVLSVDDDTVVGSYLETVEKVDGPLFAIAPPVTLLAGIGLVAWGDAWNFSQTWVSLALGLSVVTAIVGGGLASRAAKQLRVVFDETGASGARFAEAARNVHRLSWIDVALVSTILVLMVFKPWI